jgi:hypothetical protein
MTKNLRISARVLLKILNAGLKILFPFLGNITFSMNAQAKELSAIKTPLLCQN